MNKLSVPQQSQPQQLGLQTMNNVHAMSYEIHPMQLKVIRPFYYLTIRNNICVKGIEYSLRARKQACAIWCIK